MESSAPRSRDTEPQAELGTPQAGQAAELGQLERALALTQAKRAAAAATARQRAVEAMRLQDKVNELQAELWHEQDLCARYRQETNALRASAHLRDQKHQGATAEVARLQDELGRLRAQQQALCEEHEALWRCHHRLCQHLHNAHHHWSPKEPKDGACAPPVPPQPEDTRSARPHRLKRTQSQDTSNSFKPFVLFVVTSTIMYLYRCVKET